MVRETEEQPKIAAPFPNRLREIRESRGLTLEQVARGARTSHQQLQRLELGQRRLTLDWMRRIAPIINATPAEIIGSEEGKATVPIVGYVGAGEKVHNFDDPGAGVSRTEAPPGAEDTNAVIVRGESMWPKYEEGTLLFFIPTDHVEPDSIGRVSVVQVKDGPTLVKRVKTDADRVGRYRLISTRAPELEDVDLLWAARVLWTKEP